MVSQKVVIKNPTGLHLRPAGILCKEAMKFKSLITFSFKENTANAKSVLSVLGACVKCGDEVEFVCDGEDEEEALKALINAKYCQNTSIRAARTTAQPRKTRYSQAWLRSLTA